MTVETITIGSSSYSVYGTEAAIKSYLAGRLGTDAYDDASSTDRKKAHVQATRWIDREHWAGARTDPDTPQPLDFPRTGIVNCDGEAVDPDTVPPEVVYATAELELIILNDASASASGSTASNVKSVGAGSAKVSFFSAGDAQGKGGTPLPTEAWKWLSCFAAGVLPSTGGFRSGEDNTPHFDDYPDDYDLTRGF